MIHLDLRKQVDVMNRLFLISFILIINALNSPCFSQNIENRVFNNTIRTPLVHPVGDPFGDPVITFPAWASLEFHFDELGSDRKDFRFAVYHCDHNWNVSDLNSSEYLQGFFIQDINNATYSFNTQLEYIHYTFNFPDAMSKPTRSGNYGIVVFEGNEPLENALLTFRIVIVESAVEIGMWQTQNSSVSDRFKRQEIDFKIVNKQAQLISPNQNLHVSLIQNNDWSSAINNLKPSWIIDNTYTYDYNGENSFLAGSEFRFFEVKSVKFASIEVSQLSQEQDGFHVYLRPDLLVGNQPYVTNFDLNGRFLVRNDLAEDPHLESEYLITHFTLSSPPIYDADVYIDCYESDFRRELYKCTYNEKTKAYEAIIPIKQGYFNYRYVVYDTYHPKGDWSITEGNYSVTENEYRIIVYYFDRLIGSDRALATKVFSTRQ